MVFSIYNYACDFIRRVGPVNDKGVVLSRSDASTMVEHIANALHMDQETLVCRLAEAELEHEKDPDGRAVDAARILNTIMQGRNKTEVS